MPQIYPELVPNEGSLACKLWLVGESPGEEEVSQLRPFVGRSGQLLMQVLSSLGISREEVRLCNLSNYRPFANDFSILKGSYFLDQSLSILLDEIKSGDPFLIVALGNEPLTWLTGKSGITRYRGSVLPCSLPGLAHIKILPTYHPSAVLRTNSYYPTFAQDLAKAVSESKTRDFPRNEFNIHINPSDFELLEWEERIMEAEGTVASDIESVKDGTASSIICVGYAPDPDNAVVLSVDSPENLKVISRLNAGKCKKGYHFGHFDISMQHLFGIPVSNVDFDTYQAAKILNPELPAGLDYLNSVYTDIPYYKKEGRAEIPGDVKVWSAKEDKKSLYIYNGKDCIVTKRIELAQRQELTERNLWHLMFNAIDQLDYTIAMSLRGMQIDLDRKKLFELALLRRWKTLQTAFDAILIQLYGINKSMNVRSTPMIRKLLYEMMKFPSRKKKGAKGLATDDDTIASLMAACEGDLERVAKDSTKQQYRIKIAILQAIRDIREVRQLLATYVNAGVSADGRMRGIYTPNGTETGRKSGKKFLDGTGCNPQTFPRGEVELPANVTTLQEMEALADVNILALLNELSEEDIEPDSKSEELENAA